MKDLKALPKAHLHIHLEGAMRPSTLAELCLRYSIATPPDTRGQKFDNFGGFVQTYFAACDCLRSKDDLARLILEVAEDAAEQGVWWLEAAYDGDRFSIMRADTPYQLFDSARDSWLFALEAARVAEAKTGVAIAFVSAVDRSQPIERAMHRAQTTIELVANDDHLIRSDLPNVGATHAGVVAFGLHGNEQGYPPEPFADAFRLVKERSPLLMTPHAGEIAPSPGQGAASVRGAVDVLGADRIMHGVLGIEDTALVDRLAEERICLDVCPSSNILLKVFASMEEHPLRTLMQRGVPCDLGSDDPLLFGPSLLDEFEVCRTEMHMSDDELATLARNSFEFSGAPERLKAHGLKEIERWLADG
ncbi:MAG: adenosine deaminase [Gammaproteobacteria bacterium]|nr:adenosine deaminase [Gammaproteobacteria bacterium]